eukprot:TRINITY_DN6566_c0_g1_i5.p2 TRINITY_DN6566_c0_g1~~TRINITY_DN6566_c0_g1_i5.p2  ORF type:complete len:118 (-),score=21.09 TRINITY_DN6566_c0_g1_i5:258-611(-)
MQIQSECRFSFCGAAGFSALKQGSRVQEVPSTSKVPYIASILAPSSVSMSMIAEDPSIESLATVPTYMAMLSITAHTAFSPHPRGTPRMITRFGLSRELRPPLLLRSRERDRDRDRE